MFACHLRTMLVVLLLFSSQLYAQNKSVSLRDALKKVTKTYGTQFVYDRQLIEGKTTTYHLNEIANKPVEEILKGILYPNNLVFLYVKQNYYTIVAKDRVGEIGTTTEPITANTSRNPTNVPSSGMIKVTGVVIDSTGKGVPN